MGTALQRLGAPQACAAHPAMNICTKHYNKTAPEQEGWTHSEDPPQHCRTNGWSWPPHPLQMIAWFAYFFFTVVGFGILIPLLPHHWVPAGYICTGVMFFCHLIVHLAAISVDPADDNVRAKIQPSRMPVFDRSKHAHVIENLHCYLCEVDVCPKSKHCSACNKCVDSFDHHCKWLNNCVGGRNYWLFLNSMISAALGTLLIVLAASFVFIEYFINPMMLRTDKHFEVLKNSTDVWFVFLPAAPIKTQASAILVLAALVIVLGLITLALLGQLLVFHVYLNWNRLSTYEYIMRQRHRQETNGSHKDSDSVDSTPPKSRLFQNASYVGSLIYVNPEVQAKNASSVTLGRELPKFHSRKTAKDDRQEADQEPSVSPSPQQEEPQRNPLKKRKKKKKKVFKVPEEVINDRSKDCIMNVIPAPSPEPLPAFLLLTEPLPAASQSLVLPIPAFPTRSFPILAQININPIQPAGPPADYHSESAESMDEIPVAQTRLGSAEVTSYSQAAHHQSKSSLRNSLQRLFPAVQSRGEQPRPSPEHYFSKKRLHPLDTRHKIEHASRTPSVFVSESSTQLPLPEIKPTPRPREALSGHYTRKRSHKVHYGEQILNILNTDFVDTGKNTTAA